ncbi:AgrD family cyclic lactone autoinducer peptide [[Clostridium] polysaccharolyticum]|uniref:Cyclic lactone autoinducer peptide n=1 Tax=[Clostridium] polysaccharolyticum TaxID=29364 RepID=A0A1H9Z888_9FIRM|nr:cyclic lactone autoinducer peptide [[Clostridium] polysaccharolyticum]SES77715.1 cyclic lactone autoinducer peptide [[Clostridium] polysaccharolyticum]
MKKIFTKRTVLNLLAALTCAAIDEDLSAGCTFFLYEPKRPKGLKNADKKDLFS